MTVDDSGVLTAAGPGETFVRLLATVYDDGEEIILEAAVKVTVSEEEEPGPEPETAVYTVVSGDGGTWAKNGAEGFKLVVKRNLNDETTLSHFTGVTLDNKALEKDRDYTAVSGSVAVTLSPDLLDTLSAGEHQITVSFDDGSVSTPLSTTMQAPQAGMTHEGSPKERNIRQMITAANTP